MLDINIIKARNEPNVTVACAKLDADEKKLHRIEGMSTRGTVVVSRPGLFKLIQRSDKPVAREFDRWVRHEVLPQIMDNGGYVQPDADVQAVAEAAGSRD